MPDPRLSSFRKPMNSRAAFGLKRKTDVSTRRAFSAFSLGIVKGTAITIIADGADEEAAIATLSELIDSDFSE